MNKLSKFLDLKKYSNSVLFWNGLILFGIIVSAFIDLEIFSAVMGLGSLLALITGAAMTFDNDDSIENQLWIFFFPITWFIMLVVGFVFLCMKGYSKTITPFNNWLNKKKSIHGNFKK